MKIINREIENCILRVKINISSDEFDEAKKKAYMNNSEKYPVPGVAETLATLAELRKTYGPAVLYDEALEILIPESFNGFLKENSLRIIGRPKVEDISFTDTEGVNFDVSAELYPEVRLGKYKGLSVPFEQEDEDAEEAVLQLACHLMNCDIPKHMVDNKLDSMYAQEKLRAVNDAIYHVLADTVVILKNAYHSAGLNRSMPQIRAEAMDVMLQTVSGDNSRVTKEFFKNQIGSLVKRYRDIPDNFDELLEKTIDDRMTQKKNMKPEELMDEIFKAYLGSQELDEQQWRKNRSSQATKAVCRDMLFDAVAAAEKMEITDEEIKDSIVALAQQYQADIDEVKKQIDMEPLKWQLLRDKAKALILDSAEYKIADVNSHISM